MLKCLLIVILAIEIALIWYLFGIPCLIRYTTGLICPGCGMTRAWLSVLRLDFAKAMYYNPTFWSVLFLPRLIINKGILFSNQKVNAIIMAIGIEIIKITYGIRLWAFLNGVYTI